MAPLSERLCNAREAARNAATGLASQRLPRKIAEFPDSSLP